MVPIHDYDVYDSRMRKSLIDKAFFLDKVVSDVFVDYGCADGALLGMIANIFPEYTYIGYDFDRKMISSAYETMYRYDRGLDKLDYFFHFDWDKITDRIKAEKSHGRNVCLILSSVVHEVYNYCSVDEIEKFWNRVTKSGFDEIVIRDMAFDSAYINYGVVPRNWVDAVREKADPGRLASFEKRWGPIERCFEFTHFMMKYRYGENWERELNEDYSPITLRNVIEKFDGTGYAMTFNETYALPFNVKQIKRDFGFTFDLKTHYKLIFEKN